MNIVIALLIFSVIVIVHELGHFLLAKKNGIGVIEFSLGMGPRLLSFDKGGTKYSLKLLPFGGSCMMLGEDGVNDDDSAFGNKSVWARISVIVAGPIFNFILAFVMATIIVSVVGYDAPKILGIIEDYPADEAGIKEGDIIVKLNDTKINIYREVSLFVQMHQGETVDVIYERDGSKYETTLVPKLHEESGTYLLGFSGAGVRTKGNPFTTLKYGAYEVKYWIDTTIKSLGMLVQGQVEADDVSGPVGIVNVIGDTYETSKTDGTLYVVLNMLNISILLSANLGVMNLLPLPALDGGRLIFLFIEAIRGKPINPEREGMVHFIGFVFLMLLMVFVMFNDIRQLF